MTKMANRLQHVQDLAGPEFDVQTSSKRGTYIKPFEYRVGNGNVTALVAAFYIIALNFYKSNKTTIFILHIRNTFYVFQILCKISTKQQN